jgi:hypothetical protein
MNDCTRVRALRYNCKYKIQRAINIENIPIAGLYSINVVNNVLKIEAKKK